MSILKFLRGGVSADDFAERAEAISAAQSQLRLDIHDTVEAHKGTIVLLSNEISALHHIYDGI